MTGGTLIISRAINLFPFYRNYALQAGFKDISLTEQRKDGLHAIICKMKPAITLMGSAFYKSATPYMIYELCRKFPELNISIVNTHDYPDDLAMSCITNGANSYVNLMDGVEEFKRGLALVKDGETYISPAVIKRLQIRREYPKPANELSMRQIEVVRLLCSGFSEKEIAETLHISERTAVTHKKEVYRILNTRNMPELLRTVLNMDIISYEGIHFYPDNYTVRPHPVKAKSKIIRFENTKIKELA